jgi:putative transposase
MAGLVDIFVLFVINVSTRRVFVSGISANPDRVWMAQQARNMVLHFAEQTVAPKILLRDNDGKFSKQFDAILRDEGIEVRRITPLSPNLNAVAERFVQTISGECLSHFMVFGEKHLWHIIKEFLAHYHGERPHQGLGNVPPQGAAPPPVSRVTTEDIVCEQRLGGLLKHYRRAS